MRRRVVNRLGLALLLLLSVSGAAAILYAVPHATGGTWDSVVYIGVARNLANGTGFYLAHSRPLRPLTHWAPLYPLILATPAYFGIDPVNSAKWIDAVVFCLSIFIAGIIAWRFCGRSWLYGILAALFLLFSPDLIETLSQALSEGPFITLVLMALFLILLDKELGSWRSMMGAAIALSAALLTRYAGAFFAVAGFLIRFSWREVVQKWRLALGFGLVVILPSAIWVVHNVHGGGAAVGDRRLLYHPISKNMLHEFVLTVSLWFGPAQVRMAVRVVVLLALMAMILSGVVWAFGSLQGKADSGIHSILSLAVSCIVVDSIYVVFIFVNFAFLDASSHPNSRLLCPIYPITALLLVSALALWHRRYGPQSSRGRLVFVLVLLLIGMNAARSWGTIRDIRTNGIGFQTQAWREDDIMKIVRNLPSDVTLYSDNPTLIYFFTKHASYFPPHRFDEGTNQVNPNFEKDMLSLGQLGSQKPIVLVSFEQWKNGDLPTASELIETSHFHPIYKSAKGTYVLCSTACADGANIDVLK